MQLFSPVCPRCASGLQRNGESLSCLECGAVFPLKKSVVDFLQPFSLSEGDSRVARQFDDLSAEYDNSIVALVEEMGCPWGLYTDRLEEIVQAAEEKIILDAGCGTAFPAGPFVPDNSIYLGVDISMGMLQYARSLFGDKLNFSFWHIDVERVPLPEASVDLCLSLLTLNVLSEPARSARQLDRVLRADGQVFGTVFLRAPEDPAPFRYPGTDFTDGQARLEQFFSVFQQGGMELHRERIGDVLLFHLRP